MLKPVFFIFAITCVVSKELYRVRTDDISMLVDHIDSNYGIDQVDVLSYRQVKHSDNAEMLLHTTKGALDKIKLTLQKPINFIKENYLRVVHDERTSVKRCQKVAEPVFANPGAFADSSFFDCFWEAPKLLSFVNSMAKKQSKHVRSFQISTTLEGRPISAYQISTGPESDGSPKPIIYIQGMLHAREWISPPTVIYSMAKLLDGLHENTATVVKVMSKVDFVFVPLVNIDGYLHTWSSDRYWRKNRRGDYGVDLNRNYGPDDMFCGRGSSRDKYSQVYCGTKPFSEPEIHGINDWMQYVDIKASVDVHSYAASLYVPREASELSSLASGMTKQINSVHTDFRYGIRMTTTGGTFKDNQYASFQKRPSFTLELRGNDFRIDPSHIKKSGEENFRGFLYLAQYNLSE